MTQTQAKAAPSPAQAREKDMEIGRRVLRLEAEALAEFSQTLGESFADAIERQLERFLPAQSNPEDQG